MRKLLVILIVAITTLTSAAAAPKWEAVDAPAQMFAEMRSDPEAPVEIAVRDSFIYIATNRQVSVKVFTILGQLISQESLQSGIHRLPMSAKGIYIIKIGSSTRRVTI